MLGHNYLTHSYLLKEESSPEYVICYILVDCNVYDIFRLILFDNNVIFIDIFNNLSV